MINPSLYKDVPVFKIHKKGFDYQKLIRNSIKPLSFPGNSSDSSNISGTSISSESNLNFLDTPVINQKFNNFDNIIPYKYPEPDIKLNKAYRPFLTKVVPVVRRRPADSTIPEYPIEPKLESPALNLQQKKSALNKKTKKAKKLKIPDIPLYLYENYRFQEVCKEISARRMEDRKYRQEKLKKVNSEFKLNSNDRMEIPVWSKGNIMLSNKNNFLKDVKGKNEGVLVTQSQKKFLPARKRYFKLSSEILY